MLVEIKQSSDLAWDKLKQIDAVLDEAPVLDGRLMNLITWASRYYHHPLGEVFQAAMPTLLSRGKPPDASGTNYWKLSHNGLGLPAGALRRSPKQAELIKLLQERGEIAAATLQDHNISTAITRALLEKGLIEQLQHTRLPETGRGGATLGKPIPLNPAQQEACNAVKNSLGSYATHLLDGVTGSGKTEVYLQLIDLCLSRGQQALVLIPEIGLTPQTLARFRDRFGDSVASFNSEMTDNQRLNTWESSRQGLAQVVIGTRSSVFVALSNPGIIIVDEEHDLSYKQQDGFRYNARDVAIKRAQLENIPIVLGSATPSLESLHNALAGRYLHLVMPQRAGLATPPRLTAVDIRRLELEDGLSQPLLDQLRLTVERGQQALIFINRRGFAPSLLCHDCGWQADCPACDAHLTVHLQHRRLRCHHCDHSSRIIHSCPACHSESLMPSGVGTQRSEETLIKHFPHTPVLRVDRDSTARRGAMDKILTQVHAGEPCILIGTQMLAKGHHFPTVTLVGVLDADSGLFSADFRGAERMGQLLLQVAGRSGRADHPGEVLIQTHYPDHPMLQTLIEQGFNTFASELIAERREQGMPPLTHLAMIRAESVNQQDGDRLLTACRSACEQTHAAVRMVGPLPSSLPRRANRYRHNLLLRSHNRANLHEVVETAIEHLTRSNRNRQLRWSVDVDPMETG
jgi:primosomal protein N' (replication factor Y)